MCAEYLIVWLNGRIVNNNQKSLKVVRLYNICRWEILPGFKANAVLNL